MSLWVHDGSKGQKVAEGSGNDSLRTCADPVFEQKSGERLCNNIQTQPD